MHRLLAVLIVLGVVTSPQTIPLAAQSSGSSHEIPELQAPLPLTATEYAARRAALAGRMTDDGVLVVFGSREPAADYLPYSQNAPFRYLTGVTEPTAGLILVRHAGAVTEHLFVLPRDPAREIWEGRRLGPAGAQALTGIPSATSDRFVPLLDSLLGQHRVLYTIGALPDQVQLGRELTYEQQVLIRLREKHGNLTFRPMIGEVARLRANKSAAELDRIRRSTHIAVEAHREAMRAIDPGMNEFEIRALVEYVFLRHGADGPAYSSIVGSGPNATTLHYRDANRFMKDGELLLMDVGSMYDGYATDITRTFPVNGRFSVEQRAIYEIVLAAQKAAEQRVRPGATWAELNEAANAVIADGLARLGLIDSPTATYDCRSPRWGDVCPQFRLFYMHGLGHGLGLQVHDPDRSQFDRFGPGSAVTIEPGIYVRADALDHLADTPGNRAMAQRLRAAVERYKDIGVRIEDVYVFDENGFERVSAGAPREIGEIEVLMDEQSALTARRRADVVEWYRGLH